MCGVAQRNLVAGYDRMNHFRERPFARILGIEHSALVPLAGDDSRRYGEVGLTFCYAP